LGNRQLCVENIKFWLSHLDFKEKLLRAARTITVRQRLRQPNRDANFYLSKISKPKTP